MEKREKITTILLLTLLGFIFFSMIGNYLWMKIKPETEIKSEEKITYEDIDWEVLYPFESKILKEEIEKDYIQSLSEENTDTESQSFMSNLKNTLKSITPIYRTVVFISNFPSKYPPKIDGFLDDFLLGRENYVYAYGKLNKLFGPYLVKDTEQTSIDCGENYLIGLEGATTVNNDVAVNNTIDFSRWLAERNVEFLFVSAPSKIIPQNDVVTNIMVNYKPAEKEILCSKLSENGVNILDLSQLMPEDESEYINYFYQTDHHWKTSTGLWASQIIAERLNQDFHFDINTDLLTEEQYEFCHYADYFVGSTGRSMTLGYAQPEDFDLILPKFENRIRVQIPRLSIDREGDFTAMLNMEAYDQEENISTGAYGAYLYGDQPLIKISNFNATCSKKVLVLKDSYANVVIPYLAMTCCEVDVIDLRGDDKMNCFDGSLKTFLKDNSYDMVMFLTNSTGIGTEEEINCTESLWYFE